MSGCSPRRPGRRSWNCMSFFTVEEYRTKQFLVNCCTPQPFQFCNLDSSEIYFSLSPVTTVCQVDRQQPDSQVHCDYPSVRQVIALLSSFFLFNFFRALLPHIFFFSEQRLCILTDINRNNSVNNN